MLHVLGLAMALNAKRQAGGQEWIPIEVWHRVIMHLPRGMDLWSNAEGPSPLDHVPAAWTITSQIFDELPYQARDVESSNDDY